MRVFSQVTHSRTHRSVVSYEPQLYSCAVNLTSKCRWSLFTNLQTNLIQANGASNRVIFVLRSKNKTISPCRVDNAISFTRLYFILSDFLVIRNSPKRDSVKGQYHTKRSESIQVEFEIHAHNLSGPKVLSDYFLFIIFRDSKIYLTGRVQRVQL